jgi:hypothetical protein
MGEAIADLLQVSERRCHLNQRLATIQCTNRQLSPSSLQTVQALADAHNGHNTVHLLKAYRLKRLRDESGIPFEKMVFIGDAIFSGGDNYPAKQGGLRIIYIKDLDGTLAAIAAIVNRLSI